MHPYHHPSSAPTRAARAPVARDVAFTEASAVRYLVCTFHHLLQLIFRCPVQIIDARATVPLPTPTPAHPRPSPLSEPFTRHSQATAARQGPISHRRPPLLFRCSFGILHTLFSHPTVPSRARCTRWSSAGDAGFLSCLWAGGASDMGPGGASDKGPGGASDLPARQVA